jgi:phytoene dehydrogenase-like protein
MIERPFKEYTRWRPDPRVATRPVVGMAKRYDAVIVGGGHNGLTAAAYLAKAGRSALVLERRHLVGGAAVTEEVFPGFRFSVASYVVSLLRPEIIRELDLPRHGLEILPFDGSFTPFDGDYLWMTNDHAQTYHELRRFSANDAEAYHEFGQLITEIVRFIKPVLRLVPPDPVRFDPRQWMPLAPLAAAFRDLPRDLQAAFIQMMTMGAADFVEQWFEHDAIVATMASWGIIGTYLGVRSPGTAYVMLHHYMGEVDGAFGAWGIPRGGTGAVSEAIASAARSFGAEIRTESPVARIDVRNGRATGVTLESGEGIEADVVLSNADARRTYLGLLEPGVLPEDFEEEVRRFKCRGSSGKVNLALAGLPSFTVKPGPGEHLRGAIGFVGGVDELEEAYDDAKYGSFSRRPFLDVMIPTLVDPSMAPKGKHVMSCFVQWAPYHLANGQTWDDATRDRFGDAVIDVIAQHAPNIRDILLHRQVLTPLDLEERFGLTEGNIFQGELTLEQLFFNRPVPGWARFRTPVRNLWLCGSATHPGGGIMGAPGKIAALEVLRTSGRAHRTGRRGNGT